MSEYNHNCIESRYSTCPLAQDCFGLVDDSEDCKCRLEDYNKGRAEGIYALEIALLDKFTEYGMRGYNFHNNEQIRSKVKEIAEQLKEHNK